MQLRIPLYWGSNDDEEIRQHTSGFRPINLGNVMTADYPPRHYRILHKLGLGAYSTVWFTEALHLPS